MYCVFGTQLSRASQRRQSCVSEKNKGNSCFLSPYPAPGTVLSPVHALSHRPPNREALPFAHLTGGETEAMSLG